ncbi:monovalent cation/H+ antiporter complex subunit F [Kaistia dalseonensis]|uniref:Multicomponent Na+:H+ antiporter subunit F n=1 Tax=Kaistia dalseonensis TaxID=410840 RepID=A0ABU0H818_9HYPH|nr:monovalent cation/H+ antiporter complex subunit F [Kaistia dalseonensis]MCX5495853.1 monovalent cation/H+ antiporter complex subunit F [Kaistia dalseonensis]MDQ0438454.1 multicomponent Na+:H+ antiporter subunit F [Kaistia dalseonensis]
MTVFLTLAGIIILATVAAGLWRILRGPEDAERMMAAQLLGSGGVAVLLLSAVISGIPAIIDIALSIALLAAFASAAFVLEAFGTRGDEPADRP